LSPNRDAETPIFVNLNKNQKSGLEKFRFLYYNIDIERYIELDNDYIITALSIIPYVDGTSNFHIT
jgi:hypothetical protein